MDPTGRRNVIVMNSGVTLFGPLLSESAEISCGSVAVGQDGASRRTHPCRSGFHRDVAHKPPHNNVLTPYCPARILQVECPNKRVNELVGIRGPDGSPRSNRAPTRGRLESVVLPAKSPSLSSHIEPSHADDESFRSSSPTLLGGGTGMSPVRPVGRLDLKGLVFLRIETLRQRLPRRQAAMKLPVSVLRRSCQTNSCRRLT